jgi:hypothetical protein
MTDLHPMPISLEDNSVRGCKVGFTATQLDRFAELMQGHRHDAEVEEIGDAWLMVRLFDANGAVIQEGQLPPT